MFDQILTIVRSIVESFAHMWPYLLVTIPLAVAVRLSGASKYIERALRARPILAIFLATAVGAFSPFCSCGVVPVVATLLIGGVPLAPVMSFWIASPSMDPETFFLSVSTIGWELAVWRLGATLAMSLSAGLFTHVLQQRGWLGQQILSGGGPVSGPSSAPRARSGLSLTGLARRLGQRLAAAPALHLAAGAAPLPAAAACCGAGETALVAGRELALSPVPAPVSICGSGCPSDEQDACACASPSFGSRLLQETWRATWMVVKFMALAFFLSALIQIYVPADWIERLLGHQNAWTILLAAGLGVPVYTSNLTALPLISGLLAQGMNASAALAFLVSGPTTTLPAMAAVRGLVTRRVFALYVLFSLLGAVVAGYLHFLATALF